MAIEKVRSYFQKHGIEDRIREWVDVCKGYGDA